MTVKTPPPNRRALRAAQTRQRILEAARHAFAQDGYAATTLNAIADGAAVAVQTVYAVFGSKRGILRALGELVVHDPDADAAFEAAVAADGDDRLRAFAHSIRLRWEHGHDVAAAHRDAALSDATIRDEIERVLERRRGGIRRLVADGRLGSRDRAAAIIDALTLPEAYASLVAVHGWTPDAYETWLAEALIREIGAVRPARGPRQASTGRG